MFVVSANYRNRDSQYKYLIRRKEEPSEAARACSSVIAEGVKFVSSNEYEEGFGCRKVAECRTAVADGFEVEGGVRINFDGHYSFIRADNRSVIESCDRLVFSADGTLLADGPK